MTVHRTDISEPGGVSVDAERHANERRNCPACGRYMRRNAYGTRQCPKEAWDDYSGGWSHD